MITDGRISSSVEPVTETERAAVEVVLDEVPRERHEARTTFELAVTPAWIGSCRVGMTVRLGSPHVSRWHCYLERRKDGWWIVDAGSSGGLEVNGDRQTECRLVDGDRITLPARYVHDDCSPRTILRFCGRSPPSA
jgi:FHA domain